MVRDITFATRFLFYLAMDADNVISCGNQLREEEYRYLVYMAVRMLKEQVETCPDDEKFYFENLYKEYKDYRDIIKYHICKDREYVYDYFLRTGLIC